MKIDNMLAFVIPVLFTLLLGLALKEKDEKEAYKQILEIDTAIYYYKPINALPIQYRRILKDYTYDELSIYYKLCHPAACNEPDTTWKACSWNYEKQIEECVVSEDYYGLIQEAKEKLDLPE